MHSTAARTGFAGRLRVPSWVRENLEQGLPFLVTGAVLVVVALWLDLGRAHEFGSRLSLWFLLVAVGTTLGVGGLALTLVEEPAAPDLVPPMDGYVLVERSEWDRLQADTAQPPAVEPAPEPIPEWMESPPPSDAPVPAQATPLAPPPSDPALVAKASADLLRGISGTDARPSPGTPARTGVSRNQEIRPDAAAKVTAETATSTPSPPAGVTPPAVVHPSAGPPIWQEEPFRELESVLTQLEADASLKVRARPVAPPNAVPEQCASCGNWVKVYSEQSCVVCGRPLCDSCLDRSIDAGRPSICRDCHPVPL